MEAAPFVALFGLLQRLSSTEQEYAGNFDYFVRLVLSSLPPGFLTLPDTEELVPVECACLDNMDLESSLGWGRESEQNGQWEDENTILRPAAGVFPRTIAPLLRVDNLLAEGVVSSSKSKWAAPACLIP